MSGKPEFSLAKLTAGVPCREQRHQHELMPAYKTLAVQFAAMHDGPKVMLEKGIVKAIVPWAEARAFFAKQLRRRLAQEMIKKQARACWPGPAGDPHATQAVADLNVHVEAIVDRDGEVVCALRSLHGSTTRGRHCPARASDVSASHGLAGRGLFERGELE